MEWNFFEEPHGIRIRMDKERDVDIYRELNAVLLVDYLKNYTQN